MWLVVLLSTATLGMGEPRAIVVSRPGCRSGGSPFV
jgi:hypothetical protein